jgi:nicotinate-nucleotide pyrophosphorylase (carboxylating)
MQLPGDQEYIAEIIQKALMEDAASNDVTSRLIIPAGLPGQAHIVSREAGVLAGLEIAGQVFTQVDEHLDTELYFKDGDAIQPGSVVASSRAKHQYLTAEKNCHKISWMAL